MYNSLDRQLHNVLGTSLALNHSKLNYICLPVRTRARIHLLKNSAEALPFRDDKFYDDIINGQVCLNPFYMTPISSWGVRKSFYRITRKTSSKRKRKRKKMAPKIYSSKICPWKNLRQRGWVRNRIRVTPKISSNIKIDAPKFDKMARLLPHLVVHIVRWWLVFRNYRKELFDNREEERKLSLIRSSGYNRRFAKIFIFVTNYQNKKRVFFEQN